MFDRFLAILFQGNFSAADTARVTAAVFVEHQLVVLRWAWATTFVLLLATSVVLPWVVLRWAALEWAASAVLQWVAAFVVARQWVDLRWAAAFEAAQQWAAAAFIVDKLNLF